MEGRRQEKGGRETRLKQVFKSGRKRSRRGHQWANFSSTHSKVGPDKILYPRGPMRTKSVSLQLTCAQGKAHPRQSYNLI